MYMKELYVSESGTKSMVKKIRKMRKDEIDLYLKELGCTLTCAGYSGTGCRIPTMILAVADAIFQTQTIDDSLPPFQSLFMMKRCWKLPKEKPMVLRITD